MDFLIVVFVVLFNSDIIYISEWGKKDVGWHACFSRFGRLFSYYAFYRYPIWADDIQ